MGFYPPSMWAEMLPRGQRPCEGLEAENLSLLITGPHAPAGGEGPALPASVTLLSPRWLCSGSHKGGLLAGAGEPPSG